MVSVGKLADQGHSVLFNNKGCYVDGKLVAIKVGSLYISDSTHHVNNLDSFNPKTIHSMFAHARDEAVSKSIGKDFSYASCKVYQKVKMNRNPFSALESDNI